MLMALDSDHWPQAWLIRTNIGDGNDGNAVYEGEDGDTTEGTSFFQIITDLSLTFTKMLSSFNGQ